MRPWQWMLIEAAAWPVCRAGQQQWIRGLMAGQSTKQWRYTPSRRKIWRKQSSMPWYTTGPPPMPCACGAQHSKSFAKAPVCAAAASRHAAVLAVLQGALLMAWRLMMGHRHCAPPPCTALTAG